MKGYISNKTKLKLYQLSEGHPRGRERKNDRSGEEEKSERD